MYVHVYTLHLNSLSLHLDNEQWNVLVVLSIIVDVPISQISLLP